MIRIIIADDHAVVRRGLKQIISEEADMTVLAEANNAQDVLDAIAKKKFDVVILDISMPGKSGLEVLKDLKQLKPNLAVLVLSMYPEEQFAMRVLKAGAAGYLTKESAPEELVKAIRKVYAGERYVSSRFADTIMNEFGADDKPPHTQLSDREYEVFLLLASGKTVSEIAEEITLSVKTISTYRSRILEKMKMKTNAELTHYAMRNKLVQALT
jgi:DNA-binding NarL/FixJ family response regulator